MGDLKKKNNGYIAGTNSEELHIEQSDASISTEERAIRRLREYMKKFAKMQQEKKNEEEV